MRSLRALPVVLASLLALSNVGCIKKALLNGQIESTRKAAVAADTLHDFELARHAAFAGLVQFEGMHKLAPDNTDALFLLTKGYSGAAFAFMEDEWEIEDDLKHRDVAEYHRLRAVVTYERAIAYGQELLAKTGHPGFAEARKDDATLRKWLRDEFTTKADAQNLFWLGHAWLSRTNANKEDPDTVADLWVGVAVMERSVELDDQYNFGAGLTALASYHARTAQAEVAWSKELFDRAMAITSGRALITKFNYATKYLCAKADKAAYVQVLTEIVEAGDTLPESRLTNVIAKRKARRYLGKARMAEARENCGFD